MSDTPQNEEVINEVVSAEPVTNDSIPHSEGGEQVQAESIEQVDEAAVAQEKANAAFNKQYGEKKQLERDLAAQREENSRYQQADRERQAAAVGNIPPMPDSFDYDDDTQYQQAVKNRDDAIRANTTFQNQNDAYLQDQQNTQLQQQQAAQVEAANLNSAFANNAKIVGATDKEYNDVIVTLNNGGITMQAAAEIMRLGEDGYYIAKYLAGNAAASDEFNRLSPVQQGMQMSDLKQKASVLKPKTSNAPSPAANLTGNGVDPSANKYKHSKGVKFY